MQYVTNQQVKDHLGIKDDVKASQVYDLATSLLHALCRVDSLLDAERVETYKANDTYTLRNRPRSVQKIWWVTLTSNDYLLTGRLLQLDIVYPTDKRWNVSIEYTSWVDVTPELSSTVLSLCSYVYTASKGDWLSSYTQGDISMTFKEAKNHVSQAIINKYSIIQVY